MIKVVVYDDNNSRRGGLRLLIDAMEDMTCVGAFMDCSSVIEQIRTTSPHVVLMDINMPKVDGIQGVKLIKEEFPEIKIIMQTIYEDESKIIAAISAGADGYILKQKSPIKLIDGIHEVLNGGAPITSAIAGKILKLFNAQISIPIKGEKTKLTKRESEILHLLVEGYSYKMIAQKCYIGYPTVNTHISHIYKKMQVQSVASAVAKALREGLV